MMKGHGPTKYLLDLYSTIHLMHPNYGLATITCVYVCACVHVSASVHVLVKSRKTSDYSLFPVYSGPDSLVNCQLLLSMFHFIPRNTSISSQSHLKVILSIDTDLG